MTNSETALFESVAAFCAGRLERDEELSGYLKGRGLTAGTIRTFGLGSFPQDLRELFAEMPAPVLREAGIIRNASSSVFQTWNLVMPIRDVSGRAVALAGRCMLPADEQEKRGLPKYMNTVYAKSHHLFGLHLAKQEILESGTAYLAEGYFDVMMAHQAGIRCVVACCGTAMSRRHVSLLSRYAARGVVLFDNDKAGRSSARRAVARRSCEELPLSAADPFPEGVGDLAEFLESRPAGELLARLEPCDSYSHLG